MSSPERFEAPPKAGLIISGWLKSGQRCFKYTGQIIGEVSFFVFVYVVDIILPIGIGSKLAF